MSGDAIVTALQALPDCDADEPAFVEAANPGVDSSWSVLC
jgi:hypothetical protein